MALGRRAFLQRIAWTGCAAMAGGGLLVACSDDGDDSGSSTSTAADQDCGNGAEVVYIRTLHDHTVIELNGAQVLAAVDQDYTLLQSGHTHTFRITASDFQALQALGTARLTSNLGGNGHVHDVEITC